jgi:hypothetical protein
MRTYLVTGDELTGSLLSKAREIQVSLSLSTVRSAWMGVVLFISPAVWSACDYSLADINDGWGWNPVTRQSCQPRVTDVVAGGDNAPANVQCDYSQAVQNDGWGWNAQTGASCRPNAEAVTDVADEGTTTGVSVTAGCDYSNAQDNGSWGWDAATASSCPPQASQAVMPASCDYSAAAQNGGWGWNFSTGESCPPGGTDGAPDSHDSETDSGSTSGGIASEPVHGCAACGALPAFVADRSARARTVHVSEFGATGGGGAEHVAVQRAVSAAGAGGRVLFESGRTYNLCQMITAMPDQIWQPSSDRPATLRRCAARVTTLTADVSAGSTLLPVASVGGFETGMWVSPVLPGRNDFPAGELVHHPIRAINATSLSVLRGMEQRYPAGSKVVTSFSLVRGVDNTIFEGLIFDGNAAQNDHFVSWARHSSLWLAGQGGVVRHNRFINSQGEAITAQGQGTTIEYNEFDQLNGSAVHLSDARDTTIRGNHIRNTNQRAARVHHSEAAITWSTANRNITVEQNCLRDTPVAAFGEINVHGRNDGATIRANQICRTGSLLLARTVENLSLNLSFNNNVAEQAGSVVVTGLRGTTLADVELRDNRFDDTTIEATDTRRLLVDGNRFSLSSDDADALAVSGGLDTTLVNNHITGGRHAITITHSNRKLTTTTTIDGNTLLQQSDSGLLVGNRATIDSENLRQSDFRAVSANGNTVSSNQITAGRAAVELGRGASFSNGCVESNAQGIRLHGYAGSLLTPLARVTGNDIDSAGVSIVASPPYTAGIDMAGNAATNGVVPSLLAANPGAQAPGPLANGCTNR